MNFQGNDPDGTGQETHNRKDTQMEVATHDDTTGEAFAAELAVKVAEGAEKPQLMAKAKFPISFGAFSEAGREKQDCLLAEAMAPDTGTPKCFAFAVQVAQAAGRTYGEACTIMAHAMPTAHAAWICAGCP
jgi:hypothetical protein